MSKWKEELDKVFKLDVLTDPEKIKIFISDNY